MSMLEAKSRFWNEGLFERVEFHGHGGLFLAVGLRMGLQALTVLDLRGWFGIMCIAKLHWRPPDSCVIDGVQVSTGCTMGKHNISVEEKDGISADFEGDGRRVTIKLREDILNRIRCSISDDEKTDEILMFLRDAPDAQLFELLTNDS